MCKKNGVLRKIKALRIENNTPVKKISSYLGYKSTKGYYDLESGRSKLTIEKLELISKFYKLEIKNFFAGNSSEMVTNKPA